MILSVQSVTQVEETRQHNCLKGWGPVIVGNEKNISLVVFCVTAWYYTDMSVVTKQFWNIMFCDYGV